MLESQNVQIPESSQIARNEFFGLQRNIGNWANSPILQTRKLKLRDRNTPPPPAPRPSNQGSGSPCELWTVSQQTRTIWGFLGPLPKPQTHWSSCHTQLSWLFGKTDGGRVECRLSPGCNLPSAQIFGLLPQASPQFCFLSPVQVW